MKGVTSFKKEEIFLWNHSSFFNEHLKMSFLINGLWPPIQAMKYIQYSRTCPRFHFISCVAKYTHICSCKSMQLYRMSPLKWKRRRTFLIFAWSDREETSSTGTCCPLTLAVMSARSLDSSSLWTRTTMTEVSPSEIPNLLNASEICIREDRSYMYDAFLLWVYACALWLFNWYSCHSLFWMSNSYLPLLSQLI